MRYVVLIAFLFNCVIINADDNLVDVLNADYSKADSIVLNLKNNDFRDYGVLARFLSKDLTTQHEKLRVIFRWITENIDYKEGNKSDDPYVVLKTKKAVCIGYAVLLKKMCETVGIECEVIPGFSKRNIDDFNMDFKKSDHAWNAVKLYGKWYLTDVTWATCYYDEKKRKIIKDYDNTYFLTDPVYFSKKHLPEEEKWQLIENPVSRKEFKKSFIYHSGFYILNINNIEPQNGIIRLKATDTLIVRIKSNTKIVSAAIDLGYNKLIFEPQIQAKDEFYFIKQKFVRLGTYKLDLFLNNFSVATFKLEIY